LGLFLEKFHFGIVQKADEAEADKQIEIGRGKVDAAADLGSAADPLV
jgi:hypothetical protein